jgi:flagellar hook-associated protein 2
MTSSVAGSSTGLTTTGGRTYLSGLSSGINTSALIEAAYNQRVAEAVKIDAKIEKNTNRINAFSDLQTLANAVQTSLSSLRQVYGSLNTSNVFDAKSGTLSTANSSIDPTKILGVALDTTAQAGSYTLEVVQKATAHKVGSAYQADPAVALGYNGVFSIGLSGGATKDITVSGTMTLNDIATAINAEKATTGVTASVLKISTGNYQLVLSANETNKAITTAVVSGDTVMQNLGVTNGVGAFINQIQPQQAAQIRLDGVLISRDSNTIDDLITGVTFDIVQQQPGTDIFLTVGNDTTAVKSAIMDFVDSYNALRDFVAAQQVVTSDGEVSADAILFGDTYLKSFNDAIQPLIAGSYGAGGADMATLRELGITHDATNHLTVDETILDDKILNNFDEVQAIFETTHSSNNTDFRLMKNTARLASANIVFDITVAAGVITGVSANGDNTLFDISGGSIIGKKGTIYEGLTFGYVGAASATVTFSMKQGVADLMDNTMEQFADVVTGVIQEEKLRLDEVNTQLSARADRIRERADDYRNRLVDKYAKFEAQLAQSQILLEQMRAIIDSQNSKN